MQMVLLQKILHDKAYRQLQSLRNNPKLTGKLNSMMSLRNFPC